jgi:hypothetical protein
MVNRRQPNFISDGPVARDHASIMEFENFSSVKASTRRRTPVSIKASTSAFTFSTLASASTTGVVSERVTARIRLERHGHAAARREPVDDPPRQDPSGEIVDHGMEIRAGPVEQTDDGGVDMPHLVRARRPKPNLGFGRM